MLVGLAAVLLSIGESAILPAGREPASETDERRSVDDTEGFVSPDAEKATGDWGGIRNRLECHGIEIGAYLTNDGSLLLSGGRVPGGAASRTLTDLSLTVDLGELLHWRGARVHVSVQWLAGEPATPLTGDVQVFDNIDASPFVGLSEAWFEQSLFSGRLRLQLGRIEANNEFAAPAQVRLQTRIRARRLFLQSSMGYSPTIVRFPTYPRQSLGLVVQSRPLPRLEIKAGAFDAVLRPSPLSDLPARPEEVPFSSVFLIGEAALGWRVGQRELAGGLTAGGWGIAGDLSCEGCPATPTGGPYLVVDQHLWRDPNDEEQRLAAFLQYGWADDAASEILHHVGAGLTWRGLLPTRDEDVLGAGISWVHLDDADLPPSAARGETALELFYRARLAPWAWLQPDLQFLVDPGGTDPDVLVGTLRLGVDL